MKNLAELLVDHNEIAAVPVNLCEMAQLQVGVNRSWRKWVLGGEYTA
jgi:hypothetical protein